MASSDSNSDSTTALRLKLIDHGYRLVECRGKRPFIDGWQLTTATAEAVNLWQTGTNTGFILGPQTDNSWLIAVDIDVLDPARAMALDTVVTEVLGESELLRIGQAPKRLRLWRLEGERLPKKVKVHFAGAGHLEILTQGQQCIGYGIHPDTGLPYTWPGDRSPENTSLEDVPVTTFQRLENLVARLCGSEGGSLTDKVNGHPGDIPAFLDRRSPEARTRSNGAGGAGHAPGATATPIGQFRTDGRETYMTSLIWAALVGEYRECPIRPSGQALEELRDRVLADYYAHTEARLAGSPDTLAARLEQEGRGRTLFVTKWGYAFAKWDDAVAKAAGVPDPHPDRSHKAPSTPPAPSVSRDPQQAPDTPATAPPVDFDLLNASAQRWRDKEVPEIAFVVADLFPMNAVSIIGGDSGAGKSIFLQTMTTCIAANRPFLNRVTRRGTAVYITAEDTDEILHARQARIMTGLGLTYDDLGDRLVIRSMADDDIWLYRNRQPTELAHALVAQLMALQPVWVTIDSAAFVFDDEEILRRPVLGFMSYLNRISRQIGCGIGLVAHTSRSSKGTTTTMVSGSTGWVAQSRSGVLLEATDDSKGVIVLLIKPNYTKKGLKIDLTWSDDGILLWDDQPYEGDISPARANLVLDEIERRFQAGFPKAFCLSPNSPRSLLKFFKGREGGGLKAATAQRVLESWVNTGMIEEQEIGYRQVGIAVLKRSGPA